MIEHSPHYKHATRNQHRVQRESNDYEHSGCNETPEDLFDNVRSERCQPVEREAGVVNLMELPKQVGAVQILMSNIIAEV